MTLPLYYKAGRRWSQLCPRTLCHRGIALGILSILVIGMLCTTLLVGMWTEVEETALAKRGLEDGETPKDELENPGYERDLRHLQPLDRYQPTITSASTNGGSLAVGALQLPVDLLGGLTGVMSNFHVGQTTMTPSPTAGAVDPLAALSVAFQQAIANGELLHNEVNIERRGPEARGNNGYIQDSVIWAGQPSLVSMLSDLVGQVCVIDSGAGARLIDTILIALPVDSMGITSMIPSIAEYSSVSAADILPLILPAIAAALGKHLQPARIADTQNIDGIMANIIWHGGVFVGEIINSKIYLASTELYDVLNQVAGLMCAAADHLALPLCAVSKQISGISYEIVIPCDCAGSWLPSAAPQDPQSYMPERTTSVMDWSITTLSPTGGYSYSLSSSNLPPKYEKSTLSSVTDTPAQSGQPYSQPQQTTSCTSTLPPAYSTISLPFSTNEYSDPPAVTPIAACPVCSCPDNVAPAYSTPLGNNGEPERPEGGLSSYGQSRQSTEPTTTADTIPKYSEQGGKPSQNPGEYHGRYYKIPGTNAYSSSPRSWRYLGCFSDGPARVVQGGGLKGTFQGNVSNKKCMEYCRVNGFTTAGTEDGRECWCGNSIAENIQLLPATACSTACQGDTADYCGGTWAISIYTSDDRNRGQPKYRTLSELLALN